MTTQNIEKFVIEATVNHDRLVLLHLIEDETAGFCSRAKSW
jgi:hypothetical protein